jgi:hypothetical protein
MPVSEGGAKTEAVGQRCHFIKELGEVAAWGNLIDLKPASPGDRV